MEDSNRYLIQSTDIENWVRECETRFSDCLNEVAYEIGKQDGIKLIRLSGPTCSGKTTLANLLKKRLGQMGKRLHLVSIDDFYYDKDILHARTTDDGTGRVDYDSIHTIDLPALREFTREIFTKEHAECPVFDFVAGRRSGYRSFRSESEDIFIFEGIQAIYPEVTELFAGYGSIGIYIAPRSQIQTGETVFEPNEIRLMRRLVRDSHFRGTDPERTFALWSGVRQNEENHIFPFSHTCEYQIDSTMPYEIGVLKPFLEKILPTVPKGSAHRATADRILEKIASIETISSDLILPDSLYKEFI